MPLLKATELGMIKIATFNNLDVSLDPTTEERVSGLQRSELQFGFGFNSFSIPSDILNALMTTASADGLRLFWGLQNDKLVPILLFASLTNPDIEGTGEVHKNDYSNVFFYNLAQNSWRKATSKTSRRRVQGLSQKFATKNTTDKRGFFLGKDLLNAVRLNDSSLFISVRLSRAFWLQNEFGLITNINCYTAANIIVPSQTTVYSTLEFPKALQFSHSTIRPCPSFCGD
jgi:hypothetical protein